MKLNLLSLFSGKKQNKNNHGSSASDSTATANSQQPENVKEKSGGDVCAARNTRLSCGVPRSPTLPADIRRSSSVAAEESRREAPALVAKLMGLEAAPVPASPESVSEKRQKLLGALQRCDEDLKALKKIIDAVRSADPLPAPSPAAVSRSAGGLGEKMKTVSEVKCSVVVSNEQQQPSPVSVLDEFMTRSPLSPSCHSGRHSFGKPSLVLLSLNLHNHHCFCFYFCFWLFKILIPFQSEFNLSVLHNEKLRIQFQKKFQYGV